MYEHVGEVMLEISLFLLTHLIHAFLVDLLSPRIVHGCGHCLRGHHIGSLLLLVALRCRILPCVSHSIRHHLGLHLPSLLLIVSLMLLLMVISSD